MSLQRAALLVLLATGGLACGSNDGAVDIGTDSQVIDTHSPDVPPETALAQDTVKEVQSSPCKGPGVTAFVNVTVIPMTGDTVLSDHTVVVSGKTICAVGPSDSTPVPEGAKVIEGTDRFLIPGLADMHVHLNFETDLIMYLANGVTTIRSMWGFPWGLELQPRIDSGEIPGPELFTTGPIMDGDPPVWSGSEVLTTPEEAIDSVKTQIAAGYQFMKVYNRLTPEVYNAIVTTASQHDVPVVGHVPDAVGLENVLQAGQHTIEHLTGYDFYSTDNTLEQLTAQVGTWNCPTLVVFDKYAQVDQLQEQGVEGVEYVHPQTLAYWKAASSWEPVPLAKLQEKVALLHQLEAPLIAGTDATNPYVVPGFSLHEELQLLADSGLTNLEVLETATKNAAICLGTDHRAGTIEVGMDATLVLLDADPLEDIAATRSIAGVMAGGQWWSASQLQIKLDEQAQMFQVQYSLDFDCPLPDTYESPPEGDHVLFKARGEITDFGSTCFAAREIEVRIDGQTWDVDSFSACATGQFLGIIEYVGISSFSSAQLLGPNHVTYNFLSAAVPKYKLQQLKADADYEIQASPNNLFVAVMEMKSMDNQQLFKMCPVAVAAKDQPASSLFVCHDDNESFAVGETLQMAGRIALSTEADLIQNTLFMDNPCNCWKNEFDELTCDQFDAQ